MRFTRSFRDYTFRSRKEPRYSLRLLKKQTYAGATTPRRRRVRRKLRSIGGKGPRMSRIRELREKICRENLFLDNRLRPLRPKLERQLTLDFDGQRVTAQVKGPYELDYVGNMFHVSLPKGDNFYVYENLLESMQVKQD